MRRAIGRMRLALAGSPDAQFRVLWGFFLCAETASYLLGVLSATLLVKRAGADRLPEAYLWLNAAFMPIVFWFLTHPPRSSFKAVRLSLLGYLAALLVVLPGLASNHPSALIALYVVARLGKLIWSTFAVGMVAEVLSLREAKSAVPALLAAGSGGIVLAGLALRYALALVEMRTAFLALAAMLAIACALLVALDGAVAVAGTGLRQAPSTPLKAEGIGARLRSLLSEPLARVIAMQNLFVVGLRYFIEFVYAGALSSHFATESEMAGFSGSFEATLQVATTFVQLGLSGYLMARIRVAGMALLMPSILAFASLVATASDSFTAILACQFLFWIGSDGFNKPVRQVMIGALPPASASAVPVAMAALGMSGSIVASTLLVPLARLGSPRLVMLVTFGLSLVFLLLSFGVGRSYRRALSATLATMDEQGLSGRIAGLTDAGERAAAVGDMLDADAIELRLQGVREATRLDPEECSRLLTPLASVDPDPRVRASAIGALATARSAGLFEILRDARGDPDPRVRATALESLAELRHEIGARDIVLAGLGASDGRERAAAILGTIRLCSDPAALGAALDALIALLDDPDERARSAGVFVAGRLGHAFLYPTLESALGDPHAAVRRTAVEALLGIRTPAALALLQQAQSGETDPEAAQRIRQGLERMADESVRTVLDLSGHLSGPERAMVGQLVASGHRHDRMTLVQSAVLIARPQLRAAFLDIVSQLRGGPLVAVLERCLVPRGDETDLKLAPLLAHLATPAPPPSEEAYGALRRLTAVTGSLESTEHLRDIARRLWTLVAIEPALPASVTGTASASADNPIARRRDFLLDHLLRVASAATRQPDRTATLMRSALEGERRAAALAAELVEQWLPGELRETVLPVLEHHGDPVRRAREGRRLAGYDAPAGSAEERQFVRTALAAEGLA